MSIRKLILYLTRKLNLIFYSGEARIEIPPIFFDGQPNMPAELGQPIDACLATGYIPFEKIIVIELSDEGLTVNFEFSIK